MCLEFRGKGWFGSFGFFMVSDRNRDKIYYEIIIDVFKVDNGGRFVGIERDEMVGYLLEIIVKFLFFFLNMSNFGFFYRL